MHRPLFRFIILSLFLMAFLAPLSSQGARVVKVKGKKVLIKLEGDSAKRGDLFYTMSPSGKKRGIIKILKVKGNKAIAKLGRGKARKGWSLQFRPKKKRSKKRRSMVKKNMEGASPTGDKSRVFWGLMAGMGMQNMDVEISSANTTSMSGNGFSFKGLFDYALFESLWFRGMVGYEQLSVSSGDTFCGKNTPPDESCEANIGYLSLDLWGRYIFNQGTTRFWGGGGFALLFPMAKDATAVENNSITNTNVMALGFGVDIFTSPTFYIPVQLEYGLFPSSNSVKANYMAGRIGLAFAW